MWREHGEKEMEKRRMNQVKSLTLNSLVLALAACASGPMEEPASDMQMGQMEMAPFGGEDSVDYANKLWNNLESANLVGANAVISKVYTGQHPHGAVLDTIDGMLSVDGHTGVVIVKRNYGGPEASIANVGNNPAQHLQAITVMYKREAGYDEANKDWFWAKYLPDGSLDMNPAGMSLAGRVAKGESMGCIACHTAAPGGDYVFNHDRFANQ
jgi:hypothetical protein